MGIKNIIEAIRANRVRITDHADEEAQVDKLSFQVEQVEGKEEVRDDAF